MKIKNLLLLAFAAIFMASCGNKTETKEVDKKEVKEQKKDVAPVSYSVDSESSNIRWEGGTSGISVYSHYGDISIKEGSLEMKGDAISGGSFVVDMTTIEPKDENYGEENTPEKLVGHLSTGDFFLVEEYPTASFEITSASAEQLTGNLTIRDKTHEETIALENVTAKDGTVMAKGKLVFDRQKYDVKWAHYLKDVLLKDDIELHIDLTAKTAE